MAADRSLASDTEAVCWIRRSQFLYETVFVKAITAAGNWVGIWQLVVEETGDVKKGTATVGVQRQYSGTAGRIENSQVAVYLTYAAPRGHALIDRALYLPKSWTEDSDRCADAGIPTDKRGFATKPTLAAQLVDRAVTAKVPAAWVAGDEVYGADPRLRAAVRAHRLGYVLAVAANRRVPTHAGPIRVDALPAGLVTMATTTPIPSTTFPLPMPPKSMTTIYGCSTNHLALQGIPSL